MSKIKTSHHAFYPTRDCVEDDLFSVNPGINVVTALENASCFLDVARADCSEKEAYAAAYLVDMAKAIVDSVIKSI